MPLLDDINFDEDEEKIAFHDKIDLVRQHVPIATMLSYIGCRWNERRTCVVCPSHKGGNEREPSARVYPDHVYCFSCGGRWDTIGFVSVFFGMSFSEALDWLYERLDDIQKLPETIVKTESAPYKGPVPRDLVAYWHSCLKPTEREYLHNRLITDETINFYQIGWRPDRKAYTIPFWRGVPGESEIDVLQYRLMGEAKKRYIGMKGHNRPSIINAHCIGRGSVVMLFGTFDAILAAQDGIAAISTNGATAFMRNENNIARLRELLGNCKVYLVPDTSDTEAKPAYLLGQVLRAHVRHFPMGMAGKDYTDYRVQGRSSFDFFREVLMPKEFWLIKDEESNQQIMNLLRYVSEGRPVEAESLLKLLVDQYPTPVVNQHIQVRMQFDPYPGLRSDQWELLRQIITNRLTLSALTKWIYEGSEMAHRNMGGF